MKKNIFFFTFFLLTFVNYSFESKILLLYPTPSQSHLVIAHAVSTALAEKGHEVTVVSSFPLKTTFKNHREIYLELHVKMKTFMDNMVKKQEKNPLKMIWDVKDYSQVLAEYVFESENLKKLMSEKFDLVIVPVYRMLGGNFLFGFAEHFKCPAIGLSVQRHMSSSNLLLANPLSVSAVPNPFMGFKVDTFVGRVMNFAAAGFDFVVYNFFEYVSRKIYE